MRVVISAAMFELDPNTLVQTVNRILDHLWVPILLVIVAGLVLTGRRIVGGLRQAMTPQSVGTIQPAPPPPTPPEPAPVARIAPISCCQPAPVAGRPTVEPCRRASLPRSTAAPSSR